MSDELNIYLDALSKPLLSVVERLRERGPYNVNWWTSKQNFETAEERVQKLFAHQYRGKLVDSRFPIGENDYLYFEWNLETQLCTPIQSAGLKTLIWCAHRKMALDFLVVGEIAKNKEHFYGFLDENGQVELPDCWCRCKWVSRYETLYDVCHKSGHLKFSLQGNPAYRPAGIAPVKGTPVYVENRTGNFVHKDTLHKDHFEVYDRTRKHIGILSADGVAVPNSAVPGRFLR